MRVFEGIKSAKQKYVDTGQISEEVFEIFLQGDPTRNKKYIDWLCKEYAKDPDRPDHKVDVVDLFDQLTKRNLIDENDINKYTFSELDQVVSDASQKKTKSQRKREIKTEECEVVKETDRYKIVVPKTYDASKKYGSHTQWCISGEKYGSKPWDDYKDKKGYEIYFVIDKKTNKKYAVLVGLVGVKIVWNELNQRMPYEKLKRELGLTS